MMYSDGGQGCEWLRNGRADLWARNERQALLGARPHPAQRPLDRAKRLARGRGRD